ncbi:patatin-like protein 2, partial [Tanacetum coccineum]
VSFGTNTPQRHYYPLCDNATTILSIDGSTGKRGGIIPSVALSFLETELQKLDGKHARLADYFDVMAGTSTGGLIATLLSTPNDEARPIFKAKDVLDFHLEHSARISLNSAFDRAEISGGLWRIFNTANNPTMVAIHEASMYQRESRECGQFLVLSLGTGSPFPWVNAMGSFDLVEYYILSLLELVHSDEYYLRNQDDKFSDNVALENLVKSAKSY